MYVFSLNVDGKHHRAKIKSYLCITKIGNMWQTLLLSAMILLISFVFLAIKILFVKKGAFPKTHVSQNEALRKKGITCVQAMDLAERKRKGLYAGQKS